MDFDKIEDPFLPPVKAEKKGSFEIRNHFIIWSTEEQLPVGFIRTTWKPSKKTLSYGGGILPRFRRMGFAREARLGIMRHYAKLGVEQFKVLIRKKNTPSVELAQSLGFVLQVEFEAELNGQEETFVRYVMLAQDLPAN